MRGPLCTHNCRSVHKVRSIPHRKRRCAIKGAYGANHRAFIFQTTQSIAQCLRRCSCT
ncbi:hypothetical protein Z946_1168 [Sulfitobacter noctilucicola]|nr:hypothetical protein Z946_1168 [Sulfitobacter noctilucicola]